MNSHSPSVFLLRKRDNKTKLYLGNFSTRQGLALFDEHHKLSVTSAYFEYRTDENGALKQSLLSAKTVREAIDILGSLGPHDFSCELQGDIQLSSHDDGECHIVVPSNTMAKELILISAPNNIGEEVWTQVSENPNCYASLTGGSNEISVFQSFRAYLDASDAD